MADSAPRGSPRRSPGPTARLARATAHQVPSVLRLWLRGCCLGPAAGGPPPKIACRHQPDACPPRQNEREAEASWGTGSTVGVTTADVHLLGSAETAS